MRFEVENTDGIRNVFPYLGKDNNITYTREDERRYEFKEEIKELTFTGEDYKYFVDIEKGEDRCKLHTLRIYNDCNHPLPEDLMYTGTFSGSDGNWDLDRCTVKFKIKTLDAYSCIEENDDDVNIFDLGLPTYTVNLGLTIGFELFACLEVDCDEQDIEDGQWTYIGSINFPGPDAKVYLRLYMLCPCDYLPSSEWVLLDDCNENQKKYIKEYSEDVEEELPQINDDLEIDDFQNVVTHIDNGFDLKDVMQALLDQACEGLTIVSEFFQWNPPYPATNNYVTNDVNKYTNIKIFQKSDVKRPNISGNATKAETNFKDKLEEICNTFNLGYKIIDDEFRLEHISWFEKNLGIDLTNSKENEFILKGTRKYSYDNQRLPKFEKFSMMESGSIDFIGTPIWYDSNCVNNDEENKKEFVIESISTDVMYCLENSDSENENVDDDGFVLIACDADNNILFEQGILENNSVINNTLSWAHLHRDLWKHGRVLQQGYMNNELSEFESVVPTLKQDKFNVVLTCKDIRSFDPLKQIRSTLGWGFLNTAELNLTECTMSIEMHLEEIIMTSIQESFGDFDEDFDADFD